VGQFHIGATTDLSVSVEARWQELALGGMLSGVRAVVVDDHGAFRSAAERLLTEAGIDVVGAAGGVSEGRDLIERLDPDVVLLDVQLPDGNGFDLAGQLTGDGGRHRMILMTSSRTAADYRARMEASTVTGFISKDELSVERLSELLGFT
jgi:DNA-binding NarL/FixJ family response regulator